MRSARILVPFALLAACAPAATKPMAKPAAAASASSIAVASPPSAPPVPPKTVPLFVSEKFLVNGKSLTHVFAIEGATIVTNSNVVGYIDGDRVEWIAKVPVHAGYGKFSIDRVGGKYLDAINVQMSSDNGRAMQPTWLPLTGKGTLHVEAGGGGFGEIHEALIGDSVLISTHSSMDNSRISTVRGPTLTRKFIGVEACKKEKDSYYNQPYIVSSEHAIVRPESFAGAADGTLVAAGHRCGNYDEPFAEVWAPNSTTSRLVDLRPHWKHISFYATTLRGRDNDLWMYNEEPDPILHFKNGEFTPMPRLTTPIQNIALSPTGDLYAFAGEAIHRLNDRSEWEVAARVEDAPKHVGDFAIDSAGRFYWARWRGDGGQEVFRLRETKQVPVETSCDGWFAYLGHATSTKVSYEKVLAAYPNKEGLELTRSGDFKGWSTGMTGVKLASKAEADAFVEYARPRLPTENPVTLCFTPTRVQAAEPVPAPAP